jgi:uncharacterized protein YqjF (DUF2071 family)
VQLRQPIRDLFLATWETEAERIRERLPEGFEPIASGGRALVAVACFRNRLARLGVLPVPPYAEIDLRTFVVDRDGSSAVFVFAFFVPAVGLAAAPFGVPVQVARIKIAQGSVSAPRIDVAARYGVGGPAALGDRTIALSTHPSAYWLKNGRLRKMAGGYHGVTWRRAELAGEASFGPAARLGLDPNRPDAALYADRAQLGASLPAEHA